MKCGETRYLAVWRRAGGNSIQELSVQDLRGEERQAKRIYPVQGADRYEWNAAKGSLCVEFSRENMAALYRLWFILLVCECDTPWEYGSPSF